MKTVYRALIVEDSIDVRRVLKTALELMVDGFQVADVPSAEEALLEFHRQPVDLLITDMRLPGMTGVELVNRMRLRKPDLKAILVTGMTDPEYRLQAEGSPADAFFQKPIDIPAFIQKVRSLLMIPEPVPAADGEAAAPRAINPTEWLAWLRLESGALGTFLLSERGKIVAQAGESPLVDEESDLMLALMAVLSSSKRAVHAAGKQPPQSLFCLAGQQVDFYLSLVGAGYGLLVVKPQTDAGLFDLAFEKVRTATAGLVNGLGTLGISVADPSRQAPAPAGPSLPEPDAPEHDDNLAALVLGDAPAELAPDQVDAFWDSIQGEDEVVISGNAEVLSYEEARRLGLTPDQRAD